MAKIVKIYIDVNGLCYVKVTRIGKNNTEMNTIYFISSNGRDYHNLYSELEHLGLMVIASKPN